MALRWKAYAPNTILKAVEVQDLADNGVIQLDTAADLDDADLVNVNMVYVVAEAKPYVRQSAGVGASHWQVFSGGLAGLGGWADITATTGSPTKHDYTDADGNDWTAYEWTGDGSAVVEEGLADLLIVGGGGRGIDPTHQGQGGYVSKGITTLKNGTYNLKVGAGGTSNGMDGLESRFGPASRLLYVNGGGYGSARGAGGFSNPDTGTRDSAGGVISDITGAPIQYGQGQTGSNNPPTPGSGAVGANAKSGVVIVRVPRSNAIA